MRQIIKFGFMLGLIISNGAFSAEPVQGIYLGLQGQISHAPNTNITATLDHQPPYSGQIELGPIGGGGGISLGYRIQNFRLEGEFLFNYNGYGELHLGSCTLVSPNVFSPEGNCSAYPYVENNALGFNGSTMGFYGLFNVYYDFLSSDPNKNYFPYIGLGLGGALIKNHALFQTNKQDESLGVPVVSYTFDSSSTALAVQGILGFAANIDDFTTVGLDFRYVSAIQIGTGSNHNTDSQYGISTLNLTATFALDRGDH
jgi:opacity protein-like surface antigen